MPLLGGGRRLAIAPSSDGLNAAPSWRQRGISPPRDARRPERRSRCRAGLTGEATPLQRFQRSHVRAAGSCRTSSIASARRLPDDPNASAQGNGKDRRLHRDVRFERSGFSHVTRHPRQGIPLRPTVTRRYRYHGVQRQTATCPLASAVPTSRGLTCWLPRRARLALTRLASGLRGPEHPPRSDVPARTRRQRLTCRVRRDRPAVVADHRCARSTRLRRAPAAGLCGPRDSPHPRAAAQVAGRLVEWGAIRPNRPAALCSSEPPCDFGQNRADALRLEPHLRACKPE